jgi:predicted nucleic acid-binding Zn finger protein
MATEHASATASVPQDRAPLTISVAQLRALVADLEAQYPAAGQRVQHAAMIVLFRRCEQGEGRGWWVQSERDDEQEYMVLDSQCTCADYQRHGHLSPCKHQLSVKLAQRAERLHADATDPTPAAELVDVAGDPVPYTITEQGLAYLDEWRQQQAARCPTCNRWKGHGSLYCAGDRCEREPVALNLPA